MIKKALATSVFATGVLLAGAALAQPQTATMGGPVAHVVDRGHVVNGGWVGPNGRPEAAMAPRAEAVPSVGPATYASRRTTWESYSGGIQVPNPSRGDLFTFALNDLYAHNFHLYQNGYQPHHLWMRNGLVGTRATTPYGTTRTVAVNPRTGEIMLG